MGRTQQDLNRFAAEMLDLIAADAFHEVPHELLRFEITQDQGVDIGIFESDERSPRHRPHLDAHPNVRRAAPDKYRMRPGGLHPL